jgi:ribosome-binding protein aMBF1 (putative translation factor)
VSIAEICPCVNAGCPNHGQCDKCISRHVRLGNLNFCSFSTILPVLQRAIAADPESPAADVLREVVDDRLKAINDLRRKNGLSEETVADLLKKVADYSDY